MRRQTMALTVEAYLKRPETMPHEELEFGWIVREPEASLFWHEGQVTWLSHVLYDHVQRRGLGRVFSGGNVVLDEAKALVVVPDITVFLGERVRYVRAQAVGPPNLVVEIASPSTQTRDREKKVAWYRTYGVQECWLIDTRLREIRVFHLDDESADGRLFRGDAIVESRVLPDLRRTAASLLDPYLADPPPGMEEGSEADDARPNRLRMTQTTSEAMRTSRRSPRS